MVRYILRGITQPQNLDLRTGLNTIGRNPTNDFRIPEASVSSFHCKIEVSETGVLVRDLQSTNGTFIDDQPVTEQVLPPGHVLQLGAVTFQLELEQIEIHVLRPVNPTEAAPQAVVREDGLLACTRNLSLVATHRCTKCTLPFHKSSLRRTRLSGGSKSALLFCPECDGPCEAIPHTEEVKKKSFLGALSQTISLGWRFKK
ncbi:MAG: FHA domain-containing protein [Pedosphaera sp.]|nr:FHA domain-containing protein [Pedosphaera sp.]